MKIQKALLLFCSFLVLSVTLGLFSALFLFTLNNLTSTFEKNEWLVYLLPIVGFLVGFLYFKYGKEANKGTNHIIHSVTNTKNVIPFRSAIFVYLGTLLSHVVGASAGREGTAVQIGGVLAENIRILFRIDSAYKPLLLLCGIAAGFSSVFGLPYAGIVFSLEIVRWKNYKLWYIAPIAFCSFFSNWICLQTGIHHLSIPTIQIPAFDFTTVLYVLFVAISCLVVGYIFVLCTKRISKLFIASISYKPFHPMIGGFLLLLGYHLVGEFKFAGLGVSIITNGFTQVQASTDFFFKLLFTAITIGSGFKGGEVTPLFFIGVTLASALILFIPLPLTFLATLCFVGVFSATTKLPFASFVMGVELFGIEGSLYYLLVTVVSGFLYSQHSIYIPKNK